MRSVPSLALAFALGLLAAVLISFSPQASGRWEYRLADGPGLSVTANQQSRQAARQASLQMLNTLGNDGWELVEVLSTGTNYVGIFRRPK